MGVVGLEEAPDWQAAVDGCSIVEQTPCVSPELLWSCSPDLQLQISHHLEVPGTIYPNTIWNKFPPNYSISVKKDDQHGFCH